MYSMEEFRQVIAALRAPDGCPWDKKQTHESMIPCLIEETYEVIEAIYIYNDTKDAQNLCEELGDLLLQVVMQSQMAAEEDIFTLDDVIHNICDKMYRRHPHVFGEHKANNAEEALASWENAKGKEKGKSQIENPVGAVPKAFPGLYRYQKMLKKACKHYHVEPNESKAVLRISETADQIAQKASDLSAKQKKTMVQELLKSVVELAYLWDINAEEALKDACNQYADDFENKPVRLDS